ncbi:c-type cytochrome [Spartinivicinus poritis]|uniref:C-type cytochrome n=1 Tax=Spartinivicinus poritis TaxID=2994640 RepID=A0ABT5UIM6_9GAMM|nr:c-type cytochrome [Spartinivicinus sp. A2-2]MDE1466065.1 c-type cytochrome [Spartinivicinus sp. A2-2]
MAHQRNKRTAKVIYSAVLMGLLAITSSHAATKDEQIAERIKPIGKVCIEGEECAKNAGAVASSSSGPRSGEDVVGLFCNTCHATGLLDAPKVGDTGAWQARLDDLGSFEEMVKSAVNGKGSMPPKGNCADCSDEEISLAIEHMSGLKP